jgi:serine/threonine protein kinase
MKILSSILILTSAVYAVEDGKEKERKSRHNEIMLHSSHAYDKDYLSGYRYMFDSLTKGAFGIDRSLLHQDKERRASNNLYGQYSNHLSRCKSAGLTKMKTLKVLQDEANSYVMLKQDTKTGKLYVEKSTTRESSFDKETEFFKFADQNDPYFAKFACFEYEDGRFSIVTEYFEGRESHHLAKHASFAQLQSMTAQLFTAVVKLHRIGYVHADIKPGNVLTTDDYKVSLIDFGMVERISHARKYRGSPYTRAPELHDMTPGPVNEGIDWWAFGATVSIWFYYNCHGGYHKDTGRMEGLDFINRAIANFQINSQYDFTPMKWAGGRFQASAFPSCLNDETRSFLAMFLSLDSELREFNTERQQAKVRSHPFFEGFDWNRI